MARVFYSWQSDTKLNRGFVRSALDRAIAEITSGSNVDEPQRDIVIDQDTQGLPGSPPVADAILEKIRSADIFIADLTFIGGAEDRRRTPNPNVMLEYGYALHALSDARVIAVFNEAHGDPRDLPFDLAHRRWPIRFTLPDEGADKKGEALKLASALAEALKSVVAQFGSEASNPISPIDKFDAAAPGDGIGRLRGLNDHLCMPRHGGEPIFLSGGSYAYLRLIPTQTPRPLGDVEAFEITQRHLQPMSGARGASATTCRHATGAVTYWSTEEQPRAAVEASELFLTGELWANSQYLLNASASRAKEIGFPFIPTGAFEECMIDALLNFIAVARDQLKLSLPVSVSMGIVGVAGYRLAVDPNYFAYDKFAGQILVDSVLYDTVLEEWDADIFDLLEPFFSKIYDKAAIRRPSVRTVGRRQR